MLCMKHRNMVSSLANSGLKKRKLEFQHILWASSSHILLVVLNDLVRGCLAWTLAFGQVSFKSYLAAQ